MSMKNSKLRILLVIMGLLGRSLHLEATHLRAADMVINHLGGNEYEIILTAYAVNGSDPSLMDTQTFTYLNSDETTVVGSPVPEVLDQNTIKYTYRFTETLPANTNIVVQFRGDNRNAGIVNIQNSVNESIYIESFFFKNNNTAGNHSPILTVPPIDRGVVGQVYTHNPGAYDIDGDSLVFEKVTPMSGPGTTINGYSELDDFPGVTYTVDPITGDVVWDAPPEPGEYNIAIMVSEYRDGARIGFVVRDMQILIENNDNTPPVVQIHEPLCGVAGSTITDTVFAFDTDDSRLNSLELSMFSGVAENGAILDMSMDTNGKITGILEWETGCEDIRNQPFYTVFKANDRDEPVALTDIESSEIRVLAPPVTGLLSLSLQDGIQLDWDPYICNEQLQAFEIYRSDCDSSRIVRDSCTVGVLPEWGFVKIGEVERGEPTTFFDNNDGLGLVPGQQYCYLIVVRINPPARGFSRASDVVCDAVASTAPIVNRISVLITDSLNGEILVAWLAPLDYDTVANPGPYEYKLQRGDPNGDNFTTIATFTMDNLLDSSFIDTGLNTRDSTYSYRVIFSYNGGANEEATSWPANAIRLNGQGGDRSVTLTWEMNNFWHTPDSLQQNVWQIIDSDTVLLTTLTGGEQSVTINDLNNGDTLCFLLETAHVLCIDTNLGSFINYTNMVCVVPFDDTPPCTPILSIKTNICDGDFDWCSPANANLEIENELSWSLPDTDFCDSLKENIVSYNLFYRKSLADDFELIHSHVNVDSLRFTHEDLDSYAGCYYIEAQNAFGLKSNPSNTVCNENCICYELPNVFTPNGDLFNDAFYPIPLVRFVESVDFKVYNRWEQLVFQHQGDPQINWDGRDSEGKELAAGVYFYEAEIKIIAIDPDDSSEHRKGWVLIVR